MRRLARLMFAVLLSVPLSGCLGTMVHAPTPVTRSHTTTRVHILAAPTRLDAHTCRSGLSEVFTYVPLWGVVVGILTFGILVPMTTSYTCVATSSSPAA